MDKSERWARATEWPLTATALVFLFAYAVPIVDPAVPNWAVDWCEAIVWVAWAIFAVDYVVRFSMASRRWQFVKANLIDLAVVALPLLRPLRLIRLLALISILRRSGEHGLRGKVVVYTVGATLLLVTIGSLAVTEAERGEPGANITTWGDGLWWSITTMTTVGYGDRFPVTPTGKMVAAAMMIGGIALLGVITATIASWLVQRVSEVTEIEEAATRSQVDALTEEVAALRMELAAVARAWSSTSGMPGRGPGTLYESGQGPESGGDW